MLGVASCEHIESASLHMCAEKQSLCMCELRIRVPKGMPGMRIPVCVRLESRIRVSGSWCRPDCAPRIRSSYTHNEKQSPHVCMLRIKVTGAQCELVCTLKISPHAPIVRIPVCVHMRSKKESLCVRAHRIKVSGAQCGLTWCQKSVHAC